MYMDQTAGGLFDWDDDTGAQTIPSIDAFIAWMEGLEAQQRRPRRTGPPGRRLPGSSESDRRSKNAERIDLVLYTSASSQKSQKALRAVRDVLELYDTSQVRFRVCDLSTGNGRADEDGVVFTPTLVKRGPGPRTWIVGNLDHADLLFDLLDTSGVDRRRD